MFSISIVNGAWDFINEITKSFDKSGNQLIILKKVEWGDMALIRWGDMAPYVPEILATYNQIGDDT